MFIINCKNYDEVAGEKIIKLAKLSEKISKNYNLKTFNLKPHYNYLINLK